MEKRGRRNRELRQNSAAAADVRTARSSASASFRAITKRRLTHDWTTAVKLSQKQEDNNEDTHVHGVRDDAHGSHIHIITRIKHMRTHT